MFWKAHLLAPATRTSPTMKWIIAETESQRGVLQPQVVLHESNVEMDSFYLGLHGQFRSAPRRRISTSQEHTSDEQPELPTPQGNTSL